MALSLNKFDLDQQFALITGAGGLLGYEHAAALLEINAQVVLTDISKDSLINNVNKLNKDFPVNSISYYPMDVTSKKDIVDLCAELNTNKKYISILINNAAIDPKVNNLNNIQNTSRLENFDLSEWDKQISVGLSGSFLCTQVFGNNMVEQKLKGVIINIASDLSIIAPDQRLYFNKSLKKDLQSVKPVTYSVIKTGLVGLTRYISTYWSDSNIRCNCLSPGGIYNNQSDEFVERFSNLVPLGRMANSNEYRSAIQFLSSDASSYMTGFNLVLDGGRSVW